jgi:hypothetical protein
MMKRYLLALPLLVAAAYLPAEPLAATAPPPVVAMVLQPLPPPQPAPVKPNRPVKDYDSIQVRATTSGRPVRSHH